MTEPTAPTESKAPAGPVVASRSRSSEFSLERTVVAVIYLSFTAAITIYGSAAVYRDTFRAGATQNERCSDGLHRLHSEFAAVLTPQLAPGPADTRADTNGLRATTAANAANGLGALDDGLVGLRARCLSEGPEGRAAWEAFDRWRFHAQDLARSTRGILGPDVERALRYQSPPAGP